jgi:Fibronectin type III domain
MHVKKNIFGEFCSFIHCLCIINNIVCIFRYAVVSQSCSCKNSVGLLEVDISQCNSTCPGNSVLSCGGPTADSYYLTNVNAPGPVENLQINEKPSDTSIFISWSEPKRGTQADMIEIKATYLKTFSTQVVISPSWRIQANANKFELSNLHSGTSYNISVSAAFRGEYGGSSFIVAETQIGVPGNSNSP